MIFNHESRKRNVLRSSALNALNYIFTLVIGLGYRMFFLRILSVEYLGIDGLFSNILGILGLAELGITDAIIYRLYEPISDENTKRVGELMRFFRRTYHSIALVILVIGLAVCPFLKELISESSNIPDDVNLYVVFVLLLIQTSSTYLFSYKYSLLNADQKQYQVTIINTISFFVRYTWQFLVLDITKNFTITLVSGIVATLMVNWLGGLWTARQYKQVFAHNTDISERERKAIYHDTTAGLLHKIGGTVVTSTDNILLSKFIGLAAAGIYANYTLVIAGLSKMNSVVIGSLGPSFGNVHATMTDKDAYEVYKRALFLNFWIVGMLGCCLYNLIDDFIILWVGKDLSFDSFTVSLLCLLFYIQSMRGVSISYTNSSGLFTKDRMRPVIESLLNLVISIIFLKMIGTAGVFIGTIMSNLVTVFWREPYILYRYAFHQSVMEYWKMYVLNFGVTGAAVWISGLFKEYIFGSKISIIVWLESALLCAAVFALLHLLVFYRSEELKYFWKLCNQRIGAIIHR